MTWWRVENRFDSLRGYLPYGETYSTEAEANEAAKGWVHSITEHMLTWSFELELYEYITGRGRYTGLSKDEAKVWGNAFDLAEDYKQFTRSAAEHILNEAIVVFDEE